MSKELCEEYMQIKEYEAQAYTRRVEIEKQLLARFQIETMEGSKTIKEDGFKVGLTGKLNKKIDLDALKSLPNEFPEITNEVLGRVFRWTPEVNAKGWKEEDKSILNILSRAITVTPYKISFTITKEI